MIDWTNPDCKVTTNFDVKDCIWLPTWGRLANETDGLTNEVKDNLINTCAKMEAIRSFLGNKPIFVHCMFRPVLYNKIIGGSTKSAHIVGMACDFHVSGMSENKGCDAVRELLKPKLEEFDIRMEDLSSKTQRNWVHIDLKEPINSRYFKP